MAGNRRAPGKRSRSASPVSPTVRGAPASVPARAEGPGDRRRVALVLALFFASGATGLVYEVTFARALSLFVGSTTLAVTMVLAIFMGGLGLGAFLGGRRAATVADPVRAYGVCEFAIATSLLVTPLLHLLSPVLGALYARSPTPQAFALLAFPMCALLLAVPTTLMGATLPLLVEASSRRGQALGRAAGGLYAVNTLGAFVGVLAAGFVLLPLLGQWKTLALAAAVNVLLGAVALRAFPRGAAAGPPPPDPPRVEPTPAAGGLGRGLAAVAYAASGLAAMALQVGWTRAAAVSIGSSTYTFSLVVASYIFGLGVGALAISRFERLVGAPWSFGAVQVAIGVASAAVLPLFGALPARAYELVASHRSSFPRLMAVELLTLFGLVSVPTLLMGALFPMAVRRLAGGRGAGRAVGAAYGAGTLGSICGAFGAGFLLLPSLGVRGTLLLASGVSIASGCVSLAAARPFRAIRVVAAVVVAALSIGASTLVPAWDPAVLTAGAYLLDPSFRQRPSSPDGGAGPIVFYRDDPDVTVSVARVGEGHVLRLNGKVDASTFADMPTQQMLGHLPMLLHGGARRACVVGMGSGVTAGAVARYPGLERVDVVEIARSVLEGARHFDAVNHGVSDHARARFLLADGRTHLRFTRETYDVIVSEPSNPWIAGVGKLFTVEFFQECRGRLAPDGVMAAWLQTYGMSRRAVSVVLGSFLGVFPQASVWSGSPGDVILIGAKGDLAMDLDRVGALLDDPALAPDFEALWLEEPAHLLAHLALGPEAARRVAAESGAVNTDDNGWLEHHAPRTLHTRGATLVASDALAPAGVMGPLPVGVVGSDAARRRWDRTLPSVLAAGGARARAQEALGARDAGGAEAGSREALAKNPRDLPAALVLIDVLVSRARELVAAGRYLEAAATIEELEGLPARDPGLPFDAVATYMTLHRPLDALPWIDRLRRADPDDLSVRSLRAMALVEVKRFSDAGGDIDAILRRRPDDPTATLLLGRTLLGEGHAAEARRVLDRAVDGDPGAVEPRYYRAQAAGGSGDVEAALQDLEHIFDRMPEARALAAAMLREEGDRLAKAGERSRAAQAYARALIADPR